MILDVLTVILFLASRRSCIDFMNSLMLFIHADLPWSPHQLEIWSWSPWPSNNHMIIIWWYMIIYDYYMNIIYICKWSVVPLWISWATWQFVKLPTMVDLCLCIRETFLFGIQRTSATSLILMLAGDSLYNPMWLLQHLVWSRKVRWSCFSSWFQQISSTLVFNTHQTP